MAPEDMEKTSFITEWGTYFLALIAFDHQSNLRLRRVLWNPWQSNGKLRNMKNQSFEDLCHKQIRMQGEERKQREICHEAFLMTVMSATFGALPRVQFMHAICHFKAQEVKNPMLQTVHNSELK
ncbi:hypothetical protein AAG906_020472 [Vitis piasezkii]